MKILTHPNPILKQHAEEVAAGRDETLPALTKEMARTMTEAPGIGLAAPQVGVLKRVIVMDVDDHLAALANPRLVEMSEETEVDEEGCLSLPGITVPVARSVRV